MSQVKDAIELLCRVLKANGFSKYISESFRLAKFDKSEAAKELWKLLFELLFFATYGRVDDRAAGIFSELDLETVIQHVKREMFNRGYCAPDFAKLSMEATSGSREILLAIGWVLCKEELIERMLENSVSPLDTEDTVQLYQELTNRSLVTPRGGNILSNLREDTVTKLKYMLWLNGKLRMSLKTLQAAREQRMKLIHRVHDATQGSRLDPESGHLSVLEVFLLRHPQMMSRYEELLDKDNSRLRLFIKWKAWEDVFWKWMESVLDLKLKENDDKKTTEDEEDEEPEDASEQDLLPEEILQEELLQLLQAKESFETTVGSLETTVLQLEQLWEEKRARQLEPNFANVMKKIDEEISLMFDSLLTNADDVDNAASDTETSDTVPSEQPIELPRLVYKKPTPVGAAVAGKDRQAERFGNTIGSELRRLNNQVERLQQVLEEKEGKYRKDLSRMADSLENDSVIPPSLRRYK